MINRHVNRQVLRRTREDAAPEPWGKDAQSVLAFGVVTMIGMTVATALAASLLRGMMGDPGMTP